VIHEECELLGLDTVKPKNAAYTPATSKFSGDVYTVGDRKPLPAVHPRLQSPTENPSCVHHSAKNIERLEMLLAARFCRSGLSLKAVSLAELT